MPVESRATDTYTRDNLLLGFSQVYFTPLESGIYGTEVPLGILSGEEWQKTVETLELERGDAGLITVDRELLSKLTMQLQVQTFNFRKDIAQYVFASSSNVDVVADAAATLAAPESFNIPGTNPFDSFVSLAHGDIDESSIEVTCATITAEAVGTGNGVLNNFVLDYKVKALTDITAAGSITVGGVAFTAIAVGAAAGGNEVEVVLTEVDGAHPTTSGSLEFHVGGVSTPPTSGAAILATYTPSFSTTGTDIVNLTDFVMDPTLGKIRMLDPTGADNSPFRTTGDNQPLEIDYTFSQKASATLKPGSQPVFEGKATIKHLPDVGVNLIWTIPSASVRLTDDALTFDAADFATATLILNILDAGGSERFGTLNISSETEQLA